VTATTPRGASPALEEPFIPLAVPELRGNEARYVQECLDSGWVSSAGAFVERFEADVASAVGARHAVATASGTAALHVALLVAGVQPGDEVLVSALTFIAPANAIRYAGAWPVFIDAEREYAQLDPAQVAEFLAGCEPCAGGGVRNPRTGRRVRALLPVHVLGHPVDIDPLLALARANGLAVVEDATESLGARYRGRPVGRLGDVACFSFNGNKLVTTGGGGMLVTDDPALADTARYLTTQAKDDAIEYVHGAVGYNYRLTNVQAAIGVAQMERLDQLLGAKRRIAGRYAEGLRGVAGLEPMAEAAWARSAWWMYTVRIDERSFGMDSRALMRALEDRRIQTRPLWQPLPLSPAHADAVPRACPTAGDWNRRALSLPCSCGLTDGQQERVIEAVREIAATRGGRVG
jgi:perosamine synthetase